MKSWFVLNAKLIGMTAVLMLLVAGCGGDGDGFRGARGQVTGKVTFEGKPIPEGSSLLFQSTTGGYTATGAVKTDGVYALQYNGTSNLPAVAYQVQIHPPSKAAAPSSDPAAVAKISLEAAVGPFPAKYSMSGKELTFTVKEGKNTADFVLAK